MKRWFLVLLIFSLPLLLLLVPNEPKKPNIVLIIIDCWRYDHFSPEFTPSLWQLAQQGTTFSRYYVNAGMTHPSMASIFSSQYPEFSVKTFGSHGLTRFGTTFNELGHELFPDSLITFPQLLKNNGYRTICMTHNPHTKDSAGYSDKHWVTARYTPKESTAFTTEAIREFKSARKPAFLYLHYIDAHSPYNPSHCGPKRKKLFNDYAMSKDDAFKQSVSKIALEEYQNALLYLDSEINRLVEAIGIENSIWIITADHGELFFSEIGEICHFGHLPEEIVHVPLIIIGPDIPQKKNGALRQAVDLFPTILSFARIQPPEDIMGHNLFSAPLRPKVLAASHIETCIITENDINRISDESKSFSAEAGVTHEPLDPKLREMKAELEALGYLQ